MEWAPEFDVDVDLARRLIAAQFPQVACESIERFGAGMDNVAYLVDDRYVFRFPRREWVVPMLEREERILPLIAPHLPLPIPVPVFIGGQCHREVSNYPERSRGEPWTFAGYERLVGTTACSVQLTIEDRAALARPLGPGDELGRLDHEKRFPPSRERFAELEAAGLVRDANAFLDFLDAQAPANPRAIRRIVHGDLYARHVLVDGHHAVCGVIDWGDAHLGDPALDLMVAHSMLPQSAYDEFIDAYGGVDDETWMLAKYRATYHCALVAHFGKQIHDAALQEAGLAGLRFIRETL